MIGGVLDVIKLRHIGSVLNVCHLFHCYSNPDRIFVLQSCNGGASTASVWLPRQPGMHAAILLRTWQPVTQVRFPLFDQWEGFMVNTKIHMSNPQQNLRMLLRSNRPLHIRRSHYTYIFSALEPPCSGIPLGLNSLKARQTVLGPSPESC